MITTAQDKEIKSVACIYCGKSAPETKFGSREHVIPKLLGRFQNNLTLGCVCNRCNTSVFNPLETRFKEDTEEGLFCQMVNFAESHEIRIRNGNIKLSVELGFEEPFFNEAFPFLTFTDGGWKILFVPQIKIRNYGKDGGYIILLIDKIKMFPRDGKKFNKLRNLLRNKQSKDVSIFTHGADDSKRSDLAAAIDLVKELGIDYKPGVEKSLPFVGDGSDKKRAVVSVDTTVDSHSARVIAKIAFNYFAYCAIVSNCDAVLHHENFSIIKSYILGKTELPLKDVIIERPSYDPILFEENQGKIRLVAHIITLQNENGNLVSRVTFAGRLVYKVLLGKMPQELIRSDFGNGHAFDPRYKGIHGLTQNPARRGSGEPNSFRLFNNF